MSTCTVVREALPGIAAGEPDEVGADLHLESCAGCRAEREALKRDLERIRGGLAALDPASDVATGRRRVRGARGGGARVLSWWTVGIGLAAIVLVGFLLGRALRQDTPGGSDPDPRAGKLPWTTFGDVTEILERGDAARVVQVRIRADGEMRLRSRTLVPEGPWIERGPWSMAANDPKAQMDGLRELHRAFSGASPERLSAEELRALQETRVVLDVEPATPWRFVQWVLASASARPHHLRRMTFLVDDGPDPIDIDLPTDGGFPEAELGTMRLVRKVDLADPARVWTQVRWEHDRSWDFDLPANPAPPTDTTWASLLNSVEASIKREAPVNPVAVVVKTPPPTGGNVPTVDVLRVIATVREAGVARIRLEGAPPPFSADRGGGWNFETPPR